MKLYPDSGVELNPFISKNYDKVMNIGSAGLYRRFIKRAVNDMQISTHDHILDLGCGTGRNALLMYRFLGNEGKITGIDISDEMQQQFLKKFSGCENVNFIKQRIDIPFDLHEKFDKVFISFVIHGFPNEIRQVVIKNAFEHLKPGGEFQILDFAEFDMDKMPVLHRKIFTAVECKYAFDYIERDWKDIMKGCGFGQFEEHFYIKKYVRLLRAVKVS